MPNIQSAIENEIQKGNIILDTLYNLKLFTKQ